MNQTSDREKHLQKILSSTSSRKLIVAGPGTGKTYTFEQALKHSGETNNLVLTFINRLVKDLDLRLSKYATVCTFHKFCVGIMRKYYQDWHMTAVLCDIIAEDIKADNDKTNAKKLRQLFYEIEDDHPHFKKYLERATYYKAYSFNDSVYRLVEKAKRRPAILGNYDNILIDEFQDFSKSEVELIKLLET